MIGDLHVLHGLCRDRRKKRWKMRVMIGRGRKLVSKRISVDILTADQNTAVVARNAVLCFAVKLGLQVVCRPKGVRQREEVTEGRDCERTP